MTTTNDETPDFPIKCLQCGRHERWSQFKDSCEKEECKIIMARKAKNPKPQAILLTNAPRHHKKCQCDRCVEEGATKIGTALLEASRAASAKPAETKPKQAHIKVTRVELKVDSSYDPNEPAVYVECPLVIQYDIRVLGRKK